MNHKHESAVRNGMSEGTVDQWVGNATPAASAAALYDTRYGGTGFWRLLNRSSGLHVKGSGGNSCKIVGGVGRELPRGLVLFATLSSPCC